MDWIAVAQDRDI